MQAFFMLGEKIAANIPRPVFQINKSILSIKAAAEQIPNIMAAASHGSFLNYFFHLHLVNLPGLNNVTIADIFRVVSDIQFALSLFKITDNTSNAQQKELTNIPVKVKKNDLIAFLEKSTKLSRKQIISCIQELGPHLQPTIDLWDTPMIAHGEFYLFSLPSLVGVPMVCLMQKIVDKALTQKEQLAYFNAFVQLDMNADKIPYKFQLIPYTNISKLIPKAAPSILVYETEGNVVVIHTFLYKFPLSRYEYNLALGAAAETEEALSEYINLLKPIVKKLTGREIPNIVPIILTNYPIISGVRVGESYIMDLDLLMHYLAKGEYERGQVTFVEGKMNTTGSVGYRYYTNEQEFNDRLQFYCNSPNPIEEVIWKYINSENELLKGFLNYRIISKAVDEASDIRISYEFIKRLEYFVKQFFYFGKALEKDENEAKRQFVESRFQFLMPQTFSVVASEMDDRFLRMELIRIFEDAGIVGIANLVYLESALLNRVSKKPIKPRTEHTSAPGNDEQIKTDLEQLVLKLKDAGYSSLSEKSVKLDLPKDQLDRIVDALIMMLGTFELRYCTPEELENQWFYTFILAIATAEDASYRDYVAASFANFIDLLNYNFLYQKARDLSEEILEFSFKNHETPLIGWMCLLKCYTKQTNILEALVYANLVLSVLDLYPKIERNVFVDCFYQIMLLYRAIGDLDGQTLVFKKLRELDMEEYEMQKLYLSHYNGFLSKPEEFNKIAGEVKEFIINRIEKIISYGQTGSLPWAAFALNAQNLIKQGLIPPDDFWEGMITRFKKVIDVETYEVLLAQFKGDDKKSKSVLKDILLRLLETRSYHDLANEIHNIKLIANQMALNSIEAGDFEILFLYGFIANDQNLIFKEVQPLGKTHLTIMEPSIYLERINDYPLFVKHNLYLKAGQLLLWIFSIHGEAFYVSINSENVYRVDKLAEWDIQKMNKWISELGEFYFPDKGEYFINDQEDKYVKILEALASFKIPTDGNFNEVLIYTDLKIAQFPFNLFTFKPDNSSPNLASHEYKVKTAIEKEKVDFISYHKPITNVVSLEWLIDNGADLNVKKEELSIEAWSPIEDQDLVLQITCEKLIPLLRDKYGCEMIVSRVPDKPLAGVINLFLAHGGKDLEGFKTIYTKESEGHAIIKDKGIRTIIGTGEIALVFVCNSAYISKQLFSERLISFTQHILSLGYKSVVAPAWSLHPDIVTPWTEAFLDALKGGQTVSFAVHIANVKISKAGYSEYNGFYAPTGWASMHLYGNPNIRIV